MKRKFATARPATHETASALHASIFSHAAVVVVNGNEPMGPQRSQTAILLVEALEASPHRAVQIEPRRAVMPVRQVEL
jgi:hypothetical protein